MAFTTIPAAGAKLRAAILNALITEVRPVAALKGTSENVTSSTTLQNDDELLLSVEASVSYLLEGLILYSGDGSNDIKLAFTFPTGATVHWSGIGAHTAWTGNVAQVEAEFGAVQNATSSPTSSVGFGNHTSASVIFGIHLKGSVVVGANAGTLQLQWAQNGSTGNATTVRAGSWIRLTRI